MTKIAVEKYVNWICSANTEGQSNLDGKAVCEALSINENLQTKQATGLRAVLWIDGTDISKLDILRSIAEFPKGLRWLRRGRKNAFRIIVTG